MCGPINDPGHGQPDDLETGPDPTSPRLDKRRAGFADLGSSELLFRLVAVLR